MIRMRTWKKRRTGILLAILFALGLAGPALPEVAASQAAEGEAVVLEWARQYKWPGMGDPTAIAVDGQGNVLVTGSSWRNDSVDYLTIKYSPRGKRLWARRFKNGDPVAPVAMAVDHKGNVLVTGTSSTIKYSPWGRTFWIKYHGPGSARAMAVDAQGNVYVTGSIDLGWHSATIKYSPDGRQLWVQRFEGGSARAMAVDAQGNVYITGNEKYSNSFTVKYRADGQQLWVERYHSPEGFYGACFLALDGRGNVYVNIGEGEIYMTPAYSGTIKYSPDGQQLWERSYRLLGLYCGAQAMAIDTQGQVYVLGMFELFKYSTDGELLWSRTLYLWWPAMAMALDRWGNVYVTGSLYGGPYDYATVKYSPEGEELWELRYNNNDFINPTALAVDGRGNVYVTGMGDDSHNGSDYYLTIKYSQTP